MTKKEGLKTVINMLSEKIDNFKPYDKPCRSGSEVKYRITRPKQQINRYKEIKQELTDILDSEDC
jgi:hypothetical protein